MKDKRNSVEDFGDLGVSVDDFKMQHNEEVQHLKLLLKEKDRLLQEYRQEHGVLETFFRSLRECVIPFKPCPSFYKPPVLKKSSHSSCSAVLEISDTHMGAIQKSSEIEGFGEFNPQICRERCLSFIKKSLDWTELHRKAYTIDECVVLVLGDLISGDIHQELMVTNAFPSPVQAVESGMLLSDQIAMLAPFFKKVRVEFVVEDNHSRLTKKPQSKEAGLNSLNYVVGCIAKERLINLKNVEFNMYPQYEAVVKVCNQRYLICHGHGVIGSLGIPYYGIERKVAKEAIKRMNGPDLTKFNKVILGHWHAPMAHPSFWIGGSVSGTDAYDHKAGRQSKPSQSAWLVHPVHGEFDRTDFWL